MAGRGLLADDAGAPVRRDDLMMSVRMAYTVVGLGAFVALVQPVFAGFSIFMVVANYGWVSGVKFMRYYANIAPSIGFVYCYVCLTGSVMSGVYTLYAFLMTSKRYAQFLFLVSLLLSVVSLGLSIDLVQMDEVFLAMQGREPGWYDTRPVWFERWERVNFTPYMAKDVVRCAVFTVQATAFALAHHLSARDFMVGLGIA